MWLLSLLVAGSLTGNPPDPPKAIPVQSHMPQACFVTGEVFWSESQTTALLSSNCSIKVERDGRLLLLRGPQHIVRILIPEVPGVHEFVYRWCSDFVRFDDEKVEIAGKS
jgi:hypothetical protein